MSALGPRAAQGYIPALLFTSTKRQFPRLSQQRQHHLPHRLGTEQGKYTEMPSSGHSNNSCYSAAYIVATTKITPFSGNIARIRNQASVPRHATPLPSPASITCSPLHSMLNFSVTNRAAQNKAGDHRAKYHEPSQTNSRYPQRHFPTSPKTCSIVPSIQEVLNKYMND